MPENSETLIPRSEAVREIRQACFHFADLYFHFSKVIFEELGEGRGKELIQRAVRNRAIERGAKLRTEAEYRGLPTTMENWTKVMDIPFTGWDRSLGRRECPYAAAWLDRFESEPWFPAIAQLYCNVNDPQVTESFTGDLTQRITKNVLNGDEICDREYFPLKNTN